MADRSLPDPPVGPLSERMLVRRSAEQSISESGRAIAARIMAESKSEPDPRRGGGGGPSARGRVREEALKNIRIQKEALKKITSKSKDPLVHFEKVQAMPSSIGEIVRLMDVLQPGCDYYARQQDGRGECSKLQEKLRDYAKSNGNKLGMVVAHCTEGKDWKPPSDEALSALMLIVRDVIDESWPILMKAEVFEVDTDKDNAEGDSSKKRQKLDLLTLTECEKRVVLIQYKKDNPDEDAEAILEEYLKFMYINMSQEGECAPSTKIDKMWHAHILSTREYFAFCERCNQERRNATGGCSYIHLKSVVVKAEEFNSDTDEDDAEGNSSKKDVLVKAEEFEAGTDEDDADGDSSKKPQKLNLPTLTECKKRAVLIRYKKDNHDKNDKDMEAVLEEYLKFMYIKIRQEGECAPSTKIDGMWHDHILSTRENFAFCERCNHERINATGGSSYIHHNPAVSSGRVLYKTTLEKYEEYFGHEPKEKVIWIWPEKVELSMIKQKDGESWEDYTNRWHTEYALRCTDHPNLVTCHWSGDHNWAKGEFEVECENCVITSMYIEHEDDPGLESPFGKDYQCG